MRIKLFGIFLFLVQCAGSEYDTQTKILDKYLDVQFHETIPQEQHYYVIIPARSCIACVKATVDGLERMQKQMHNLTVITSFGSASDTSLWRDLRDVPLKYDSSNKLDRLNLDLANPLLVETSAHKIKSLKSITFNNVNDVFNF